MEAPERLRRAPISSAASHLVGLRGIHWFIFGVAWRAGPRCASPSGRRQTAPPPHHRSQSGPPRRHGRRPRTVARRRAAAGVAL